MKVIVIGALLFSQAQPVASKERAFKQFKGRALQLGIPIYEGIPPDRYLYQSLGPVVGESDGRWLTSTETTFAALETLVNQAQSKRANAVIKVAGHVMGWGGFRYEGEAIIFKSYPREKTPFSGSSDTRDTAIIDGWRTDAWGPQLEENCWRQHGRTIPLPEHMSCVGGFAGSLYITNDVGFFNTWDEQDVGVDVPDLQVIRKNDTVIPAIIFSGAGADERGLANVTVDVMLTGPSNEALAAKADLRCWVDRPPPPLYDIELCEQYAQFAMKPESDPGIYIVTAYLQDHVKKSKVRLVQKIRYASGEL